MNQEQPILELDNITKIYKTKATLFSKKRTDVIALNRISLKIFRGEIFGIVGESGSGKTTVGRLIVGLEELSAGKIFLDGVEITALRAKALKRFRKKVQMIFQDPYQSLNPQLSIYDTLAEPLLIHRIGAADSRPGQVSEAMKSAGLSPPDEYLHRYPHQLSGGQRQRVAIARAMVLKPEVVVADEPTSMLDASISAQIFNILLGMRDHLDVTLLFITHSLAAARYLCDRIAVMYKGSLMEIGPADEVIQNPKHPYTRALIDALPKFGSCEAVRRYGTLLRERRQDADGTGCPFYPRCKPGRRDQCNDKMPPMEEVGDSHRVACFYVFEEAEPAPEGDACYLGT